jgi:hypothetical protein
MKKYWGMELKLHAFLTSALDEDEWSAVHPGRFTTVVRTPLYPLDKRLGELQFRSGSGGEEKKSHNIYLLGMEPRSSRA